jgi:hypothetical protein
MSPLLLLRLPTESYNILAHDSVIGILAKAKDIDICKAEPSQCPKKKQPYEINARCWRIGGKK